MLDNRYGSSVNLQIFLVVFQNILEDQGQMEQKNRSILPSPRVSFRSVGSTWSPTRTPVAIRNYLPLAPDHGPKRW